MYYYSFHITDNETKAKERLSNLPNITQLSISSVQLLSGVRLCNRMNRRTPGLPVHHQLPEFIQTHITESVMPSNHLILCRPLLLLPSIFPNIRVFSNESALRIKWSKYWSFSVNISLSSEHPGLISFRMNCLDLLAVHGTLNTTVQKHQFGDGLNELNSPLLK